MKKIMKKVFEVFMELVTVAFFGMFGLFVHALMWEYTSWSADAGEWFIPLVFMLGYVAMSYQAKKRVKEYMEVVNPKVEKIVGAINRIEQTNKDEAA